MTKIHRQPPPHPFYKANSASQAMPGRLNILGICFDGTACFRKGSKKGPDAIRLVSGDLESYSPIMDQDLTDKPYYDLGNLYFEQSNNGNQDCLAIQDSFAGLSKNIKLAQERTYFLTLGGEHSISYPVILKYLTEYPDLLLIHLDAHADLRDGYEGYHYSHAAIIRRCFDHFGADHQLLQFGIRSGTREEFTWMSEKDTLIDDFADFLQELQAIPRNRPIYLTLDLDFFDPSSLPGTGTPEPGGYDFQTFIEIITILANKKLVGADLVELAPDIDPTGNSSVFAAKVARELILALNRALRHD